MRLTNGNFIQAFVINEKNNYSFAELENERKSWENEFSWANVKEVYVYAFYSPHPTLIP